MSFKWSILVLFVGLAACKAATNDSAGSGGHCTPGQIVSCGCVDGSSAMQMCNVDGLSFSPCACGAGGAAGTLNSVAGSQGFAGNNGAIGGAGMLANAGTGVAGGAGVAGSFDAGVAGGGAGMAGSAGGAGTAGTGGSDAGPTGDASTTGGPCGSGTHSDGRPTTGLLACIVEQHNATRAMVQTGTPLPEVTWSADLAAYAQQWTDQTCANPQHRTNPSMNGQPLGENLYASSGGSSSNAGKQAVSGWSGEVACYTFGAFMKTDKCDMTCTTNMHSDGCGHYTQVVWRKTTQIGCGVTTCGSGFSAQTEVICNYAPAGNYVGQNPY